MKDNIFSSFYSKVLSFFTSGKEETESSRNIASNRLKLVLMQDRSNLDGATMQKMREQLIAVISKYIEIDTEALDLNLEGDGDEIALMLNIPVIRARTPEEIAELEEKEAQENEESQEEDEEDSDSETSEENDEDSEETQDSDEETDEVSDDDEEDSEENEESEPAQKKSKDKDEE